MSLADACLVRMTETLADPIVLTTNGVSEFTGAIVVRWYLV